MGGFSAYLTTRGQTTTYRATAVILVQYRGNLNPGTSDVGRSSQLANTYRLLVTSRPFLGRLDLRGASISAGTSSDPPILDITSTHSDPVLTSETALLAAEEFIDFVIERRLAEIARLQSAATAYGILNTEVMAAAQVAALDSLTLLEPGAPPPRPVDRSRGRTILLGLILGIAAAGGLALLRESLGDTVRFPDQIKTKFGVDSLGTIMKWSDDIVSENSLVVVSQSSSPFAEAFRQVRTNFQFEIAGHGGKTFLVSSPGPGDGKSTIIANFAATLAQTGKRVVLVDGDLRKPSLHYFFEGVEKDAGLTTALTGGRWDEMPQDCDVAGLSVVTSGPTPPNPAELVGSSQMARFLEHLKDRFDIVLVDTPPVLPVADGAIIAGLVDGAIVVVDAFGTRSSSLKATIDTLRASKVTILGVIVNKMKRPKFGYGYSYPYYSYQYSYGQDGADTNGVRRFYRRLLDSPGVLWSRLRGRKSTPMPDEQGVDTDGVVETRTR